MQKLAVAVVILALAGCQTARSIDVLRTDVGKTVADVAIHNGPPDATFRASDGRQAFQWVHRDVLSFSGGIYTRHCVYTVYAKSTGQPGLAGWQIIDAAEPAKNCP